MVSGGPPGSLPPRPRPPRRCAARAAKRSRTGPARGEREVRGGVVDLQTQRRLRTGARGVSRARNAVQRLATEGLLTEESTGRYRITPLVEVVLSTEKLTELNQWLREQNEVDQ
jgi:hypothetical protein